jgi:hypothetical protein
MNRLYSRTDLPETVLKVKRQAFGNAHLQMGLYHWNQGQIGQARAHFKKALTLDTKRTLKNNWYPFLLGMSLLGTPLATRLLQVKRRIWKPPASTPPGSARQA